MDNELVAIKVEIQELERRLTLLKKRIKEWEHWNYLEGIKEKD